jgi:protein gp37
MGDASKIEWTDATWNPIVGCSILSTGCSNCYAMRHAHRLQAIVPQSHYAGTTRVVKGTPVWSGIVKLAPKHILLQPLRWRRSRIIFVNSMSDLFHESVADEVIDQIFAVMALAPRHVFQLLTKRSARMRDYVGHPSRAASVLSAARGLIGAMAEDLVDLEWPPRHLWLGVSAENQDAYDARTGDLKQIAATVRFLSMEPLLGPIKADWLGEWVIVGGESGPSARPLNPEWVRLLRDQCLRNQVPFFFKQYGEYAPLAVDSAFGKAEPLSVRHHQNGVYAAVGRDGYQVEFLHKLGKRRAGRVLDGVTWDGFPLPLQGGSA